MGLDEYGTFVLHRSLNDRERKNIPSSSLRHHKYYQYYKGIRIEAAELSLHTDKEDWIRVMHGDILHGMNFTITNTITEKEALLKALKYMGAETYAWEVKTPDVDLAIPEGELIFARINGPEIVPENFILCYRFDIVSIKPHENKAIYVDAHSGEVVKSRSNIQGCNTTLKYGAETLYNGLNHFFIREKFIGNWVLYYCTRDIRTKDYTGNNNFYTTANVTDDDGYYDHHSIATSAHWAVTETANFFNTYFGLNGVDDNNRELRVWSNHPRGLVRGPHYIVQNGKDYIYTGTLNGSDYTTLDVMAHEYGHAVDNYSADLLYEYESGALNESFADIYGKFTEWSITPNEFDWEMGHQVSSIRSLSNPNTFLQPDTYEGVFWFDHTNCTVPDPNVNDNCGVHINSGVQNYWFFLLSQGGTHNGVSVNGIGMQKAAQIAYRNHTVYLTQNTDYADARSGSIQAAGDLYGLCSGEVLQVRNAWAAVDVGNPGNPCLVITGGNTICVNYPGDGITLKANTQNGYTIQWSNIPSNWSYSTSGTDNEWLTVDYIQNGQPNQTAFIHAQTTINGSNVSDTHPVTLINCNFKLNYPGVNRSNTSVYPNPAHQYFTINSKKIDQGHLEIISMATGQSVINGLDWQDREQIPVDKLPSGLYIIRLVGIHGDMEIHRLLIQH